MYKLPISLIIAMSINQCNQPKNNPYQFSKQMIVVKSENWSTIKANISLYEKNQFNQWIKIKDNIPAVLGKNGFGWGRGLFDPKDAKNNTYRKEGDKRAPAGIFDLGNIFGIEDNDKAKQKLNFKMPYIHLTDSIRCIGEGNSKYYNQIVDTKNVDKDWLDDSNNENMRYEGLRDEQAYKWGIFINNNVDSNPNFEMKRDKNSGSCIFIHIWKNQDTGTAGCTAIREEDIEFIISWLDPQKNPLITQLPEDEYKRLKDKWDLP